MSSAPSGAWRPNVAAVVVDDAGNVLLGGNPQRNKHWHFPQGGVESGESFAEAVLRELWEETGLEASACRIVARFGGLRYRYREDNPKSGKWQGQEQCYFLLRCEGVRPAVQPEVGNEFSSFVWKPWHELRPGLFAPAKRKAVRPVLDAFFPKAESAWSAEEVACRLDPQRYRMPAGTLELDRVDAVDRALFGGGKEEAAAELRDLGEAIAAAQRAGAGRVLLLLFGLPGCGMKSCLRRMASCTDPLSTRLLPPLFTHPAPDFLWPLHEAVPPGGMWSLLSHSPYDVLLEDGGDAFARRTAHLKDFETMLAEEGVHLVKAYLHISRDKFLEKECNGMDDAERQAALQRRGERERLVAELLAATDHKAAPWHIIPSDRRWYRDMVLARLLLQVASLASGV